jgi:hypothetical protein
MTGYLVLLVGETLRAEFVGNEVRCHMVQIQVLLLAVLDSIMLDVHNLCAFLV